MKVKEGEYVRIVSREVTPADVKSGMYYPYFRGLAGVADKIYDDQVCLRVDLETLPADIAKRHLEIQESMKRKWLNGLSGEARNRLTAEEKQFNLSYTILVQSADLEKAKPGDKPKPVEVKSAKPVNPPAEAKPEPAPKAEAPKAVNSKSPKKASAKAEEPHAVTAKDLEDAELAFLKEREKALKGEK